MNDLRNLLISKPTKSQWSISDFIETTQNYRNGHRNPQGKDQINPISSVKSGIFVENATKNVM